MNGRGRKEEMKGEEVKEENKEWKEAGKDGTGGEMKK